MATMHGLMDYYVGDTVMMDVTVTDANGIALDLTNCDLEWMLNDPDGVNVETYSIREGVTTGGIDIISPAQGTVAVTVPSTRTRTYAAGYYSDQLRVWVPDPGFDDILASQLVGTIKFREPLAPGISQLQTTTIDPSSPVLEAPTLEVSA